MYYITQPLLLLSFAVLMAAGLYLIYAGNLGGRLLKDYCANSFERWTT